jgi:hypothetical protein
MTFSQFKPYKFINHAIRWIVEHIIAKGLCPFETIPNDTFWKRTPIGNKIARFFREMTYHQKIEFIDLFDIFVVGYHNGINAFISMTANPSSQNFEKTVMFSISKGYRRFTERCSGRATPLIEGDLRSSIGSTPVQLADFLTSPAGFQGSSDFQQVPSFRPFQGVVGQATQPVSPFQGFGGGPENGFSLFNTQPPYFGGIFQPVLQRTFDPFTAQANFIPVSSMDGQVRQEEKLAIRKGRVIREIHIPSGDSSGPSTSSTVGGIAKYPKEKTPIATTIANLEKKISRLERENPAEGCLNHSELRFAKAKLKKIQNSL